MSPSVTIILPTFRRPRLLARALRSIMAQTCNDFTVLICDNHSGDSTAEVVAGFAQHDSRVTYHCHRSNIGALANFGWGFSQVDSEFFCLISDDDLLLPECLAIGLAGLRQHPRAMAWGGQVLVMGDTGFIGSLPSAAWPEGCIDPPEACGLVCRNIRPQNTGMIFRRGVLDLDFHPALSDFHAVDVLWTLHAAAKGGIGITREPVAIFIQHEGSTSTRAGNDPGEGITLYWPSARYLHDHFPQGRLSAEQHAEFLRLILVTYGIDQFRHLGRMAAVQGRRREVAACIRLLEQQLQDRTAARWLRRLSSVPVPLLRLYFGLQHRITRPAESAAQRESQRQQEQIARLAIRRYDIY